MRASAASLLVAVVLAGCGPVGSEPGADGGVQDGAVSDGGDAGGLEDGGLPDGSWLDDCGHVRPNAFANEVVRFTPGDSAGFGQENFPCIVLGPPQGKGPMAGSLDVLSLGEGGSIVLKFTDLKLVDGPGPDLLVFENAFPGWLEPGFVAVSEDGETWHEWSCEATNEDGGYQRCAGIHPTLSSPANGVSPTDPEVAGGDAFDLAELGVSEARYVRVRDSGAAHYGDVAGGFDLDAIAAVHWEPLAHE